MADTMTSNRPGRLHYAWIVAIAGGVATFCGLGLARFAFGMLLPSMSASLGLDYGQSGVLGFAYLIGYLVAVALVPVVLRRFGNRVTTSASVVLIAVTMLGIALGQDFLLLWLLYALTGVGSGGVVVPVMSLASHWFHPSHRGLAAGILMSGPGLGVIISGFVVPKLTPMAGFETWQLGWLLFAAISAGVAVLAFALLRDRPENIGADPFGRAMEDHTAIRVEMSRRTKLRMLIHMGLIFALYGATYMAYVTFIVTSMVDTYGMSPEDAGRLWAGFGFLSLFSGILFGSISDRLGRRAGMALAFGVLATAYLLVGFGAWMPGLYLSILLFGLAAWSIPVIMSASAGDYFGPAGAANALAALVFVFSAGQAAGPLLAGYLADLTGDFTLGYAAAGLIALLTILLIRALRPPQVSG